MSTFDYGSSWEFVDGYYRLNNATKVTEASASVILTREFTLADAASEEVLLDDDCHYVEIKANEGVRIALDESGVSATYSANIAEAPKVSYMFIDTFKVKRFKVLYDTEVGWADPVTVVVTAIKNS